jgi:hypothetical protein
MGLDAVRECASLLAKQPGLEHINIKKHGDSLIFFSGEGGQRTNHARLTSLGGRVGGLSLAMFGGRWERTPFVGTLAELTVVLVENFAGYLEACTPWLPEGEEVGSPPT